MLGYGSYSVIYSAEYCGKQCVVKKMPLRNEKSHKSLKKDCQVLLTLKHPCIVQILGILYLTPGDPGSHSLLMERMWMSLNTFVNDKRPLHTKVSILHDVACGLCYIHKKGIIHCDLTGNNILLTESFIAKIADFGQAIIYDQEYDKGLPTAPGNEAHMPPEAFKPNPDYSTKLDVFSFGCVIIHTVTQQFPKPDDQFIKHGDRENYTKVSEIERRSNQIITLKIIVDGNTFLYDMVKKCLQDDPHDRPSIEEVLAQLKELPVLDKPLDYATLEQSQVIVNDIQNEVVEELTNEKRTSLPEMHPEKDTIQPEMVNFLSDNEQFQVSLELHFCSLNFIEGKCV